MRVCVCVVVMVVSWEWVGGRRKHGSERGMGSVLGAHVGAHSPPAA
jgi:hypothetical protein